MPEAPRSDQFRIRVERLGEAPISIDIGDVPPKPALPDEIVFIDDGDAAFMRLHIHYPAEEYHLRTQAIAWAGWIVVGFAARVVLISILDGTQRTIALSDNRPPHYVDYFCDIECGRDHLLVCSGRRVFRIGEDGEIRWKSAEVGVDGVSVHDVTDGIVRGSGEWDPPGGWQPFLLSLSTGLPVGADEPAS